MLPNFLIVGTSKAGTSSLYRYLKLHPEIFFSEIKEPKYFVYNKFVNPVKTFKKYLCTSWNDYSSLFKERKNEKITGEASVAYLYYYKVAIPRILEKLGSNIKITIILRNPTDRAFSAYMHLLRDNRENLSFEEALIKEKKRKNEDKYIPLFFYKSVGLYYNQVKAYLDNFSNVKIYLFEDLINNKEKLLKDLFDYLEVDTNFIPLDINTIYNKTGIARYKSLKGIIDNPPKIIRNLAKIIPENIREKIAIYVSNKNLKKPEMKEETRKYLNDYYKKDILKLQNLINRDLSAWLK